MICRLSIFEKNTDDILEHELDYTKNLLNVVGSNLVLVKNPKIKERFNMLKEILSDIKDYYIGTVVLCKLCHFVLVVSSVSVYL